MEEAPITDTDVGRVVEGPGWFVLDLAEAAWERLEDAGSRCSFEAESRRSSRWASTCTSCGPGSRTARPSPRPGG